MNAISIWLNKKNSGESFEETLSVAGPDGSRKEHQIKYRRNSSKRRVIGSIWSCISTLAFDLLCYERVNGLMPRQQLAQPGHLKEADLHNFTDLVPPVAFAVFGAFIEFTDIEARKHPAPDSVATEDAMSLADGGVVCNCDKP